MKTAALFLALTLSLPAHGMTQDELLRANLLPGWRMDSGHHMAGLSLALAPGWKTYWRSPGEAGIPPEFDWSGSQNVRAVYVHWPSPVVFHTNGMQTVGYDGGVILPLEVVPEVPGQPVVLRARVGMGICKDICMPAEVLVSADLVAPGADPGGIRAALKAQPASAAQAGVGRVSCAVEPIADGLRLTATVEIATQGGEEAMVMEPADRSIWVGEAMTSRQGGTLTSVAEMVAATGAPFALDRSSLRLTVLGGARAVQIEGCPAP
jgi:DsbC/DsbD-like thiol-disulfide interchange protein